MSAAEVDENEKNVDVGATEVTVEDVKEGNEESSPGDADASESAADEAAGAEDADKVAENKEDLPAKFLEWNPPLREYRNLGPGAAKGPAANGTSSAGTAPPVPDKDAVRLWRGAAGTQAQAAVARAEFKRRAGILLAIEEERYKAAIAEAEKADAEAEDGKEKEKKAAEGDDGEAAKGGAEDEGEREKPEEEIERPPAVLTAAKLSSLDDVEDESGAPRTWGELNQAVDAMPGQYWCDKEGKPCVVAEGWANRVKDDVKKRRYFVLTRQRLCFFFKEADAMVKPGESCQTIHCAASRDGSEDEHAKAAHHEELKRAEDEYGAAGAGASGRAGRLRHKSSSSTSTTQFTVNTFFPSPPGGVLHGEFMHDHLSSFSSHGSSVRLADVRRVSWRIGRSSIRLKYFDGHEPTVIEADSPDTAQVWAEAIQEAVDAERRTAAGYAGDKKPDTPTSTRGGGKGRADTADSEADLATSGDTPPSGRRHTVASTPDRSQQSRGSIFGSLGTALSSPFRMFGGPEDPKAAEAARKKAEEEARKAKEEAAKRTKEQELKIKWDARKADVARRKELQELRDHRFEKFTPVGCRFVSENEGGLAPADGEKTSIAEGGCFKREKQLRDSRNQAWLEDASGRPLVLLHGWCSKKDVGSSLFGDADRDRYLVLTPFHLCYYCSKQDADCYADGYMHGKSSGAHPSSFMGTGARLALEAIVDVEVVSATYEDEKKEEEEEEKGEKGGAEKKEAKGAEAEGDAAEGDGKDGDKEEGDGADGEGKAGADEAGDDGDAAANKAADPAKEDAKEYAGEDATTEGEKEGEDKEGDKGGEAADGEKEDGQDGPASGAGAGGDDGAAGAGVDGEVDETKVDPDSLPKVNLVSDDKGRFEQSHIVSLDMGDRTIRIELYSKEYAERWCNAIETWSKWWKVRMDEAAMNAFGDAAAYRSMMQASGDGSIDDEAKQKEIAAMKASSGGGGRKYVQGSRRGRGGKTRGRGRGRGRGGK